MLKIFTTVALFVGLIAIIPQLSQGYKRKSFSAIVETKYGKIKGYLQHSRENRPFYSFKAIPFAKPPVAELRFKAPLPPEPWEDILDAKNDSPYCIQQNYLFNEHPEVEGEEDCLYINVYTPKLPSRKKKILLPVMVNIHFGGFMAGTGRSDYMGPEYFMDKKVILVTFNYRLAVFGFLSTNDDASPGNWAFKDQVAALKWVQENIGVFGGNNQSVTIFGQSAGAGSVHHHILSPVSAGLFHRAISQSGSALSLWGRPNNVLQTQVAKMQAHFVGCDPETDTQTMVSCLRNVDAVTLANSSALFKYFSSEPFTIYGPATETKTQSNPEPFMVEDPLDIVKQGKFPKIPWILGVVKDEGILRASPLLRNSKTREELNEKFNEYGPQILGVSLSVPPEEVATTWKKMTDHFIQADYVNVSNPEKVQGFIDMFGDRSFIYGSYQSALIHAWKGHDSIWFYKFGYKGEYSYGDLFAGTEENIDFNWGVSHSDDLLYLFPSPGLFEPLKASNDILMSKILIQMWTDFAIKGDPSPNNKIRTIKWSPLPNLEGKPKATNADLHYLNIVGDKNSEGPCGITLNVKNDFFTERMRFWESLPLAENIEGLE